MLQNYIAQQNMLDLEYQRKNERIGLIARMDPSYKPTVSALEGEVISEYGKYRPLVTPTTSEVISEFATKYKRGYASTDPTTGEVKNMKFNVEGVDLPQLTHNTDHLTFYDNHNVENALLHARKQQEQLMKDVEDCDNKIKQLVSVLEKTKTALNSLGASYNMTVSELETSMVKRTDFINKIKQITAEIKFTENKKQQTQDRIRELSEVVNVRVKEIHDDNALILNERKNNEQKVNEYRDQLARLNSGPFNTNRLEGETEEEFLDRLRSNADIEVPIFAAEDANAALQQTFKESLRKLIKSNVVTEQVVNHFANDLDTKLILLKKWSHVETEFNKFYKSGAGSLSYEEVLEFLESEVTAEPKRVLSNTKAMTNPTTKPTTLANDLINFDEETIPANDYDFNFVTKTPAPNRPKINEKEFTKPKKTHKTYINHPHQHPSDRYFERTQANNEVGKNRGRVRDDEWSDNSSIIARKINWNEFLQNGPVTEDDFTASEQGRGLTFYQKATENPHGLGVPRVAPQVMVPFGRIFINLEKLRMDNVLSVKLAGNKSIAGFPNQAISVPFVSVLETLIAHKEPNKYALDKIQDNEKHMLIRMLHLGRVKQAEGKDKAIDQLKKRLKLLEDEINIGNNSKLLQKEIYQILHSLKDLGAVTQTAVKKYMKQL